MLRFILFTVIFFGLASPLAHAEGEDQGAFPFDKPCLQYNKDNFTVGQSLLEVMKNGDFPQFCTLYSLSNYQVKEKWGKGYFITGAGAGPKAPLTKVFLKTDKAYKSGEILKAGTAGQGPSGQWAYFTGEERFMLDNGSEQAYYTFEEIDF